MNLELKMRTDAYRKYMGPSGNGMSDHALRKLAGWSSFQAGWDAAVESMKPIKRESLCSRSTSG